MNFPVKITVNSGRILRINDQFQLVEIAAEMANYVDHADFPGKRDMAFKALQSALNIKVDYYEQLSKILDINQPATKDYVQEIIAKIENIYQSFLAHYNPPTVLPDGTYEKCDCITITSRR